MPRLSVEQVTSWRLSRHHLEERAEKRQLTRVVEDVCGVQARYYQVRLSRFGPESAT